MGNGLMAGTVHTPIAAGGGSGAAALRPIALPAGVVAAVAIGAAAAALIEFDLSARAFVAAFFSAVLVVLAAIDLERRIIPNRIVVPAGIIVLFGNIAAEPGRAKEWTIAAFATMFVALVVSLATRGGFGMGDVKLTFLLGAGLGWDVLGAVVVAMLATFVVSAGILARRGLSARKEAIPFGPFLALGALVALFFS
jgi:leader peptidase (prepilin peptidase) / N-methyltransferase